jgi:predicted DNA-binding transcriptional regulator YafY
MNRTDRLLAIVLELQGKGKQRAEDLAATFEVSKRTIYRDIEALSEAGVPIAAAPGVGYTLVSGYFLPPLSFTVEEATILLLGSDVMHGNFDAHYREAAASAGRKIAGVLPERLRGEVRYLQESIRFIVPGEDKDGEATTTLQKVRRAILEYHTVVFNYHARNKRDLNSMEGNDTGEERKADPYGLVHVSGSWYMVAYDHARRDVRNFRLERIERLQIIADTFQRPKGFSLGQRNDERPIVVRALFDQNVARWIHESPSYFAVSEEDIADGLLVTLRVRQERDVLGWLLGWGRHVRVLEPESLIALMAEEAERISDIYR